MKKQKSKAIVPEVTTLATIDFVLQKREEEITLKRLPRLYKKQWISVASLILCTFCILANFYIVINIIEGHDLLPLMLLPSIFLLVGAGYAVFMLIDSSSSIRTCKEELRQVQDELEEVKEDDNVKRSEKLFRNHQRELNRYYDINLGHYRWIFPVGVLTVILGSAIIGGTIWVFRHSIQDSIAPILIGAVSGVLVDFIGAVLIHMYTETVKSSIAFHSQLMKSNHALFANMLAFKIEDKTKHDETFAELAKLMIQSNVEPKK